MIPHASHTIGHMTSILTYMVPHASHIIFPASHVTSLEVPPLAAPLLPPRLPNPGHSSTLIIIPSLTLWSLSPTPTSSEGDHMTYHAHLLPRAGIDLSVDWGCS